MKELKDIPFPFLNGELFGHVESGEGIERWSPALRPLGGLQGSWNPVKELKGELPKGPQARVRGVESGEGIES